MSAVSAVVLGALLGWLASLLARSELRMGFVLHIGVGIVGALLGFAASAIGGALAGAVLLLVLFELARRRRGNG
jgi:uncharacterized membrane protein YeaQ/YmgE (transglycosylase-associated protein family)